MFDFDVGKLLLIGVVALIFIPPKDLPNALRQLGRIIGQARRMAADFQGQFSEAMREAELTQIKDELGNLKQQASVEEAFSHVADMLETKVEAPLGEPAPPPHEHAAAEPAAESVAASPSPAQDQPPPHIPMPQPAPIPIETEPLAEPVREPATSAPEPGKTA
jgi:sec-independent protein translocase protein TatB